MTGKPGAHCNLRTAIVLEGKRISVLVTRTVTVQQFDSCPVDNEGLATSDGEEYCECSFQRTM
jgi:hypothetical protein